REGGFDEWIRPGPEEPPAGRRREEDLRIVLLRQCCPL
ncbi:hypothetical protein L249_3263, partial [Ophiocordyceps polyrhachis-furcata BCC 54312]